MARKKSTGYARRRSRRVGAMNPGSPIMKIGAIAVGYLIGKTLNNKLDSTLSSLVTPPVTAPAVTGMSAATMSSAIMLSEIVGGGLLLTRGKPSLLKTGLGGLLAGAGLHRALVKAGMVSGYQNLPVLGRAVRGYQQLPVLGGIPAQLEGYTSRGSGLGAMPAQLQGYGAKGSGSGQAVMGAITKDEMIKTNPASGVSSGSTGILSELMG